MDCGPACLRMVAAYYGRNVPLQYLREQSFIMRSGVSLQGINTAAESIGLRTLGAKITFEQLDRDARLPCILHWNQNHFVVLPPQDYNRNNLKQKITIADPSHGLVAVPKGVFLKCWAAGPEQKGIALLLEPTPEFFQQKEQGEKTTVVQFLKKYFKTFHKKYLPQVVLGMVLASLLSLLIPFLTQATVDYGINMQDKNIIFLLLIGQLGIFLGIAAIGIIQGWLLLYLNSRMNLSMLSDFLFKMMKLPIRFFESKQIGDVIQRLNDHKRIEQFLTSTTLSSIFSLINLIVFSFVLAFYNLKIFAIFLIGSCLAGGWMIYFQKRRADIDYARFQRMGDNQSNLFEIITGMQDIKLTNSETLHRWSWERIQAKLFRLNVQSLTLEQYQSIGSTLLTQLKNILVTYCSAIAVINGTLSLGEMLSISYIIGQLTGPIDQLLNFFRGAQDARLSIERLTEIQHIRNEDYGALLIPDDQITAGKPPGIVFNNVSFTYGEDGAPQALKKINLVIPPGKITAIIGTSGSGKTTLMKLLLKFYSPQEGCIFVNDVPMSEISPKWWRDQCGVVMQDGHMFSDTIARNISLQDNPDQGKLRRSAEISNIYEFINDLPLKFSTKIGNTGNGISAGQKQRILISRAIFKEPKFILFDEATSALDANNERVIINNLNHFFKGRTALVIAHRLSTVRHADQIAVMEDGQIVEVGTHQELSKAGTKYYELVKNQLELGN
jgi:ATP-binding cassette subfamily B protein